MQKYFNCIRVKEDSEYGCQLKHKYNSRSICPMSMLKKVLLYATAAPSSGSILTSLYYPVINWEPPITIFVIFSWYANCSTTSGSIIVSLSKPPWPSLFLWFLAKLSIFNALQLWNQESVFTFQSGSRNQTIFANPMQYLATMNCHQYQIHAILLTITK